MSETSTDPSPRPGGSRLRSLLLVGLVAALVVSAGLLVFLGVDRGGSLLSDEPDQAEIQAERDQVMAQTRQFALRINTYGPDQLDEAGQMPDYRSSVLEVMTARFGADFEQGGAPLAEQTVAQAGVARTAEVYGLGVSVIDADSATALVAGASTTSYPDTEDPEQRVNDIPRQFRWEVSLNKVDGQWLVDDYVPVTGTEEEDAQQQAPTLPGEPAPEGTVPDEVPETTPPAEESTP